MFIMEATKMPEILQDLSWAISQLIYSLMPNVYAVFEYFAKEEFFSSTEIANFWNNLYILLSVLVLFAIGIKLLSSIVNPDVLDKGKGDNKKKSAKQSFIDAIVAVFLVILVPIVFGILNDVQREVIESNFIPEYILGKSINISSEANVGQVLAYETLSSFLQPCSNEENPGNCNSEAGVYHMQMLSYSIKDIKTIKNEYLSTTSWWDGKITENHLDYQPILAPVAGGMILYQLVLMALDMALRAVKIAFLEIMTPIILGAYIFNRDIFTRWVKEFIATYIGAFLKIMIVTLLVIGLSKFDYINSSDFAKDTNFNNTTIGILKLVLIMGILRLVKEVPNLINKIFGTNIQPQGGIRGRLGQMAGVGNLAQRAWDTLRTHPIQTTRRLVGAPISAVGGMVAHRVAAGSRAGRILRDNNLTGAQKARGFAGAILGGHFGSYGAAIRGGQQGWRYGNLRGIGAQGRRYEDTHKTGSTFGGRLMDDFRETMGLESREAVFVRNAEKAQKARSALNASYQQAQQLATSEYSNQHYGVRTVLSSSAGRNSQYHNQNLTAYQMSQAITQLRETLSNTTNVAERNRLSADIQQLSADYDRHVNTTTRNILNDASNGVNLNTYVTNPTNIQEREFASSVQNSITENIGTYGANMTMEQGTGVGNLARITGGTLGNNFDALLTGADTSLTQLTQQYRPDGTITARGRANADQRSRDNRYVDNARPPHGGGGGGNGGGH